MTTVTIRRLGAEVPDGVVQASPARLDRLLRLVAERALEERHASYDALSGEWCVRRLDLQLDLAADESDARVAARWAALIAGTIADLVPDGSNVLHFRSRSQLLLDVVVGLAAGDLSRAWAWNQAGLLTANDPDPAAHPGAALVAAVRREPRLVVPVLVAAAQRVGVRALHARLGPVGWSGLADLVRPGWRDVPSAAAGARFARPATENRVAAVLAGSAMAQAVQSDLPGLDDVTRSAFAVLVLEEVDPADGNELLPWITAGLTRLAAPEPEPAASELAPAAPDSAPAAPEPAPTPAELAPAATEPAVAVPEPPAAVPQSAAAVPQSAAAVPEPFSAGLGPARTPTATTFTSDWQAAVRSGLPEHSPLASEHPAGEHPAGEHPAGEHPAGEHPAGEHPAGEHPGSASPRPSGSADPATPPAYAPGASAAAPSHGPAPEDPIPVAGDETVPRNTEPTPGVPTNWAGLLFMLNAAAAADLPDAVEADVRLEGRPLRWVLHQLALRLVPVRADDPAALAFAGLAPTMVVPPGPPAEPVEEDALDEHAAGWAAAVARVLEQAQHPDDDDPIPTLWLLARRPGWIAADPGWLEVRLNLDDVDLLVRRAGLDVDPGWLGWLGTVVVFRYV